MNLTETDLRQMPGLHRGTRGALGDIATSPSQRKEFQRKKGEFLSAWLARCINSFCLGHPQMYECG